MDKKLFVAKLKKLMDEERLNLSQLSEKIDVDEKIIYNLLNESSNCEIDIFLKLADYFNISADYLLGRVNLRYSSFGVRSMPWH